MRNKDPDPRYCLPAFKETGCIRKGSGDFQPSSFSTPSQVTFSFLSRSGQIFHRVCVQFQSGTFLLFAEPELCLLVQSWEFLWFAHSFVCWFRAGNLWGLPIPLFAGPEQGIFRVCTQLYLLFQSWESLGLAQSRESFRVCSHQGIRSGVIQFGSDFTFLPYFGTDFAPILICNY